MSQTIPGTGDINDSHTVPVASPGAHDADNRWDQSRRLELMFQNLVGAGAFGGVGMLIVGAMLYSQDPAPHLITWMLMSSLIAVAQIIVARRFATHQKSRTVEYWRNVHLAISLCSGGSLACMALMTFPGSQPTVQILITVVLAGSIAAAVSIDAACPPSFLLFSYPPALALMWCFASQQLPMSLGLAALVGLFLLAMTRSCREVSNLVTENLELSQALHYNATHDALAGIANRREFDRRLDQAAALSHASPGRIALIAVDLDHFKTLNDTLGHLQGDRALELVGKCLRNSVRAQDVAARIGGDEFAVLAYVESTDHALRVGEKLREAIQALKFANDDRGNVLTASIGVTCSGDAAVDPQALKAAADKACYVAKRGGRDQVGWCAVET